MERISTGTALSQRGISLDTTCCPLCGDYEETATNLLTSCYVSNMVWQHISSWCKIPPILVFFVRDILEIHKSVSKSKEKKKIIQAIILIACWSLWKARNEKIFENKSINISNLLQEIKSLGYLWIKNRSPFRFHSCKDWYFMAM